MERADFKKYDLPDQPGVYFLKTGRQNLYIGKATSLAHRVASYFVNNLNETRGPTITAMVEKANHLDWQTCDSVLEALILESMLIKKYQPPYNTRAKDDKSFWYVVITAEDFPRVILVRGRNLDLSLAKSIFGPFPNASELKTALKIIRKIFPYRDRCQPLSGRACFNRQLNLCPGVCSGEISIQAYRRYIYHLELFFSGRKKILIKTLKREMNNAAKAKDFELAATRRNQLYALKHINDVALIKHAIRNLNFRIEAYDIAHLSGQQTVGAVAVVVDGQAEPSEYKRFKLLGSSANKVDDTANLKEILTRRLTHKNWPKPDLLVIDGGQAQLNVTRLALKEQNLNYPVVAVVKDEFHQPKKIIGDLKLVNNQEPEILLANSEVHRFAINYHRKLRRRVV
jgi:excinuclease ABC subunit C